MTVEVSAVKDEEGKVPEKKIPPGKVMIGSGEIIKRTQAAFPLDHNLDDPSMLRASSGTIYKRDENGVLRRLFKPDKMQRKALKRAQREDGRNITLEPHDSNHNQEASTRVSSGTGSDGESISVNTES